MKINRNVARAVEILREMKCITAVEEGKFIVKDVVLIQKYTGKTYTYWAYNFKTGDGKYLGNRRNEICDFDYEKYVERIVALDIYDVVTIPKGSELIDHIFREGFPNYGYTVREDQIKLAKRIYRTLNTEEILLSDIPVGFGKTHAYLVAIVAYKITSKEKQPLIISTSSKQLQDEIQNNYLPEISKMLLEGGIISKKITSVLRKGKSNYICDERLKSYTENVTRGNKSLEELIALKNLIISGRIVLGEVEGISPYDKRKISVLPELCYSCKKKKTCRYQVFLERAKKDFYDIQICNHNYYIADAINRTKKYRALLPNHKSVIIDEAHKLPLTMLDMNKQTLLVDDIDKLVKSLSFKNIGNKKSKSLKNLLLEISNLNKKLFNSINIEKKEVEDGYEERIKVILSNQTKGYMSLLSLSLKRLLRTLPEYKKKYIPVIMRLSEVTMALKAGNCIVWIENINGHNKSLNGVTDDIEHKIRETILGNRKAFILTSGTLAVNSDYSYFSNEIGFAEHMNRLKTFTLESPFDYANNSLLYIANDMPFPNASNERYIEALCLKVEELIIKSHGHAVVLFTSYQVLGKVFDYIKKRVLPFPVKNVSRNNNKSIKDFRASKNSVLFATGSFWEGMNFKGDLLSHLIIVKLPFIIPDPITEHLSERYKTFEEFKKEILIPRMLIKLKQGHGRAIRSETDTAVISILDIRANGLYRDQVIDALPKCNVTNKTEDIKKFIQEKKSPEYFL